MFLKSLIEDPPFLIAFNKIFLELIIKFLHWYGFNSLAGLRGLSLDKYNISFA